MSWYANYPISKDSYHRLKSDVTRAAVARQQSPGTCTNFAQRYGKTWRMIHRMIHNILNINAAVTYVPYQDFENKMMLTGFLDSPQKFLEHLRRYTFSLSTQIILGYRCPNIQDPNLQQLFWVSVNFDSAYVPFPLLTTSQEFQQVGRVGRQCECTADGFISRHSKAAQVSATEC